MLTYLLLAVLGLAICGVVAWWALMREFKVLPPAEKAQDHE